MNYWMKTIINRLETAYQTRFDMKASLVFLNDAYQKLDRIDQSSG